MSQKIYFQQNLVNSKVKLLHLWVFMWEDKTSEKSLCQYMLCTYFLSLSPHIHNTYIHIYVYMCVYTFPPDPLFKIASYSHISEQKEENHNIRFIDNGKGWKCFNIVALRLGNYFFCYCFFWYSSS